MQSHVLRHKRFLQRLSWTLNALKNQCCPTSGIPSLSVPLHYPEDTFTEVTWVIMVCSQPHTQRKQISYVQEPVRTWQDFLSCSLVHMAKSALEFDGKDSTNQRTVSRSLRGWIALFPSLHANNSLGILSLWRVLYICCGLCWSTAIHLNGGLNVLGSQSSQDLQMCALSFSCFVPTPVSDIRLLTLDKQHWLEGKK